MRPFLVVGRDSIRFDLRFGNRSAGGHVLVGGLEVCACGTGYVRGGFFSGLITFRWMYWW
jgi:hypothetical protein